MKDYSQLFENAKNYRDFEKMESLFDEVLGMVKIETAEEVGTRIAEARNKQGTEGKKIV